MTRRSPQRVGGCYEARPRNLLLSRSLAHVVEMFAEALPQTTQFNSIQ